MTREATCFSCRHVLRVAPDAQGRWLTCPRCLASVGNPYVLLAAAPPSSTAPLPLPEPPLSPEVSICPWCQRPTEPNWRACPLCEKPLHDVRPRSVQASLDDEVRRDNRGVNVIAIVLGGLLVVGAVLFVVVGGPMAIQSSNGGEAVVFVGVLAMGAFVAGLIALAVGARNQAVTAVSGVMGGLAIGAGAVLLVVLVLCLSICAGITNFMHTCGLK